MSFPALPDTICQLTDLIDTLEDAYFRTGRFKKRLDAAEAKRERLRSEQIRRGYEHSGFDRPRAV